MTTVWKESFTIKEEVPTTRFWLMCKMKFHNSNSEELFNRRWEMYISDLKKYLNDNLTVSIDSSEKIDKTKAKNDIIAKTIKRLESSAYLTIPTSFLNSLNIPRILRH